MMSINVTELLIKSLESACKDLVNNAVTQCANKYQFDANEAMRELGTDKIYLNAKKMVRGIAHKNKKAKKEAVPVPFIAEYVDQNCCQAIRFNHALFTQCRDNKMNASSYCKTCQMDADKNASGMPTCGTVDNRIQLGDNFVDAKGRKPKNYALVLKKLNIDIEDAKNYALDNHLNQFTTILNNLQNRNENKQKKDKNHKEQDKEQDNEKQDKKRGRPKKQPTQVNSTNDIFSQSTFEKVEPNQGTAFPEPQPNSGRQETESDNESTASNKVRAAKLTQEEKDAKKAVFMAMKLAEKEAEKKAKEEIKSTFKKGGAKEPKQPKEPKAKEVKEPKAKKVKEPKDKKEQDANNNDNVSDTIAKIVSDAINLAQPVSSPATAPATASATASATAPTHKVLKIDGVKYEVRENNQVYLGDKMVAHYNPSDKSVEFIEDEDDELDELGDDEYEN
jgi:hypothetical protein